MIPDVLIIGGGAIGAACGRSLAIAGAAVTIVQRPDETGDAWRASAGMLAAQIESGEDDRLLELAVAGRAFYLRQSAQLSAATGIDLGLATCGILEVVAIGQSADALKERVARQRQRGYRANWLDADEVAAGWPWLGPCAGAFWSPDDGAIQPEQLVAALRSDAVAHGARLVSDTITALEIEHGKLVGASGQLGHYRGGAVVVAAGAWAGRIRNLPRPLSVEPVRGQMMAFPWPENIPTAIVYGDHCYALRRGNEMLVGATVEHAGFELAADTDQLAALHRRATAIVPAIAGQTPIRHWAGLRPGTPDGLPIIGPEPRLAGLWYAAGHGRNGILLAGVTGELLRQEIAGGETSELLEPFRPTRFWE